MLTVGLTGAFGMGKSTVLQLFSELGAFTFNVDGFVHNILKNPEAIKRIAEVLGNDILIKNSANVSINKKHMADIIFKYPDRRKAVEKIIHPEVLKVIKLTISDIAGRKPSAIVIFEVPLLFEAGYERFFDKVIVVYCSRDRAIKRLAEKGFSRDDAVKRIRAQMPVTAKKKLADFVIDNNGDPEKTRLQVMEIYDKLATSCKAQSKRKG